MEGPGRASAHLTRGGSRLVRADGARPSRPGVGLLLAVGALAAGAFAVYRYQEYKTTKQAAAPASPAASRPAPKTATASDNPPVSATVTVQPILADTGTGVAGAAQAPARPGRMQVRLAAGVTGPFRYWFVSRSDRAARMRWLPRPNSKGVIVVSIPGEYNGPGAQLRILNVNQGKVARIPVMDLDNNAVAVSADVGPNLLQNPDFSQDGKGWSMENTAPGRGTMRIEDALSNPPGVTGRSVHFEVTAIGKQPWNVQCYQMGVNLKDREPYLLSFWAKSDRARPLHIDGILDKEDWHPVGLTNEVKLGPAWQKYLIPFMPSRAEPSHTRISFVLGETTGPVYLSGIALRHVEGGRKSTLLPPDAAVTVGARDFN